MISIRNRFYLALTVIAAVGTATIVYSSSNNITKTPAFYRHWLSSDIPNIYGYSLGITGASIKVEEFGDLQCGYCRDSFLGVERIVRERYISQGKVHFTFYDYPMTDTHKYAEEASLAAACADDQSKFWPMRDSLLSTQPEWKRQTTLPLNKFLQIAKTVELDIPTWNKCFQSKKYLMRIRANARLARSQDFQKTPTIVVTTNDKSWIVPYRRLVKVLDSLDKIGVTRN